MTSFSVLLSGFSITEGISFIRRLSYHNLTFHSVCATFRDCVNVFNLFAGLLPPSSIWANSIQSTTVSRDVFVTIVCLLDNHLTKISLCSVKSVDTPSYLGIVDSPVTVQSNPSLSLSWCSEGFVYYFLDGSPLNKNCFSSKWGIFYSTCTVCEVYASPSITLFLLKMISLYFLIQYNKVKLMEAIVLMVLLLTSLDQ